MFRLAYNGSDPGSGDGRRRPGAREQRDRATASRGKEIFEQCSGCHSAETDDKRVGPSLKGLFQRTKLRNGKPVTEKNIRSRIEQGGDGMPAFSALLSDKEEIDLISNLITYSERLLRLRIRDNGTGIDPNLLNTGRQGHWGLQGMRERAQHIGAQLEIWSQAGAGTEVDLSIPGAIAYAVSSNRSGFRLFRKHKEAAKESRG